MYTGYFGFREKPFNVTPDPRFFYSNPGYQEAYANLLYGIRERKGFLVLTGEVGTGKTTILRRLMEDLESTVRFVFFYNTTLSFEEILTFVCDELGLTPKAGGQLGKIQTINEFLLNQLRNGSTGVLFIDEAQNLREEVFENLRLLSNLETPREKLLQIVLAGQPELDAKLDRNELRQLKQRIFSQSRLSSLNEEEVGAFIDHRLKAVGYGRGDLFPRDAVREIARYSKGIPRLINIICDNALLIAYADSKKKVSAEIIKEMARDLRLGAEVRFSPPLQPRSTSVSGHRGREADDRQNIERGNTLDLLNPVVPPATEFKNGSLSREKVVPSTPKPATSVSSEKIEPSPTTLALDSSVSTEIPSPPRPVADPSVRIEEVEPAPPKPLRESVPQSFLETLTFALTEAMGPMAALIVREQLTALRNAAHTMRPGSLEKLVESVSSEILDDLLKIAFKEKMASVIRGLNRNSHPVMEDT